MKEYKLSEIKEICSRYAVCKTTCPLHNKKGCTIYALFHIYPSEWKIENSKPKGEMQ